MSSPTNLDLISSVLFPAKTNIVAALIAHSSMLSNYLLVSFSLIAQRYFSSLRPFNNSTPRFIFPSITTNSFSYLICSYDFFSKFYLSTSVSFSKLITSCFVSFNLIRKSSSLDEASAHYFINGSILT